MLRVEKTFLPSNRFLSVFLNLATFLAFMLVPVGLLIPGQFPQDLSPTVYLLILLLACSIIAAACTVAHGASKALSLYQSLKALRYSSVAAIIATPLFLAYANIGNLALHLWVPLGIGIALLPPSAILLGVLRHSLPAGDRFRRRVVIAGDADYGKRVREALARTRGSFEIVGFFDLVTGRCEEYHASEIRPRHLSQSLQSFLCETRADELIVATRECRARDASVGGLPVWDLLEIKGQGVRVSDFAGFWEQQTGRVDLGLLRPSSMLFVSTAVDDKVFQLFKRGFDIVSSLVFLALTSPILLATAVAVRLTSDGPILFKQERVGLRGRPFTLFKFRTMYVDAERFGPKWASKNDPRVTRVGKFLRSTRIDELPQLLNVLKGEMSIIGPRPERPSFVTQLRASLRFYDIRNHVKPGLTGWAQVSQGYAASMAESAQKLSYDMYYVKNCSIFLELFILLRTVGVVLSRENAL